MRLPATRPIDDPGALWSLQWDLMAEAVTMLGARDEAKKIFQPQFTDGPPGLRNTPGLDGAYVELSPAGRFYWPTVVFEMAHETVHLLNPVVGSTNNLEEGVAVAFSLHIQPRYGISIPVSEQPYLAALALAGHLPGGALAAGKLVRRRVGSLGSARKEDLADLFPGVESLVLEKLAAGFSEQET